VNSDNYTDYCSFHTRFLHLSSLKLEAISRPTAKSRKSLVLNSVRATKSYLGWALSTDLRCSLYRNLTLTPNSVVDSLTFQALFRCGSSRLIKANKNSEMNKSKKQLKDEYLQTAPRMGVFLIRNTINEKILVCEGLNLQGAINRHKFQLERGVHPKLQLQKEWNEFGGNRFAFEIVDELAPLPDSNADQRADLESLGSLWLEKLQPFGERGYNERKLSRADMLRQIAARRVRD